MVSYIIKKILNNQIRTNTIIPRKLERMILLDNQEHKN